MYTYEVGHVLDISTPKRADVEDNTSTKEGQTTQDQDEHEDFSNDGYGIGCSRYAVINLKEILNISKSGPLFLLHKLKHFVIVALLIQRFLENYELKAEFYY